MAVLPPIPEPPPIVQREKGPRPAALKILIGIELVISALSFPVYCNGTVTGISVVADVILYGVFTAFWLAILWFLWMGHNWARITGLILCALGATFSIFPTDEGTLQRGFTIINALFSLIWAWWLCSPSAIAFTKGKPA